MADAPRQRIRPSIAELRSLPPEYDFDEDEDDDVPTYAPAATVRREPPPEIGTSRGQPPRNAEIGRSINTSKSKADARVRFDLQLDNVDPSPAGPSIAALVGTIQERRPLQSQERTGKSTTFKGQSRFAVQRHLDRDAGLLQEDRHAQAALVPPSAVTSNDDEEWLDEEGYPLSAFKKKQLISKGLTPARIRIKKSGRTDDVNDAVERTYQDEGVRSMMKSISAENEAKIVSMTSEEVEQDLRELQESLGNQLLERLKNRTQAMTSAAPVDSKPLSSDDKGVTSSSSIHSLSTSEIREKYFSDEARELPASLAWTQDIDTKDEGKGKDSLRYRFDFDGNLIDQQYATVQTTVAAGLHHHGEQQDKPGYTTDELLHLARSTLPGQRSMALQTLSRIFSRHAHISSSDVSESLARDLTVDRACFIASWYIESRQASVRAAALACIRTCLSIRMCVDEREALVEIDEEKIVEGEEKRETVPLLTDETAQASLSLALLRVFHLPDASTIEMTSAIASLSVMTRSSRAMCVVLMSHSNSIQMLITKALVTQPWPARGDTANLSLAVLGLLSTLLAGHRSTAVTLFEAGLPNTLIRFLSISPWSIEETNVRVQAWRHMLLTLEILISFAKYGIAADLYGRSHTLFLGLQSWMAKPDFREEHDLAFGVLSTSFDLYAVWAICATDAHQTYAHHDITFSQVSEWQEVGLEGLASLGTKQEETASLSLIYTRAAALRTLDAWRICASKNTKQTVELSQPQRQITLTAARNIFKQIIDLLKEEKGLSIHELAGLASSCRIATCFNEDELSLEIVIPLLERLTVYRQRECRRSMGSQRQACEDLFDLIQRLQSHNKILEHWLQLLCSLPSGCEEVARKVILDRIPDLLDSKSKEAIAILEPFINELTRSRALRAGAPSQTSSSTLQITDTLFHLVRCTHDESNDIDPISQAPLWWSANSGLPLRRDWPLVALDDLLHSGNCAALNRPNVLPQRWDANETQIVEAALSLSITLWRRSVDDTLFCSPSAEEIYMGIMKVFMLEEQQQENVRASGKITGKDIYRRQAVVTSITELFEIANELQASSTDTLEAVAERQFGRSLPFYQFYTSLVGLYDGISFGFELFARALLVPLQSRYAADYRRLLWADYAHCLSTIATPIDRAPGGFASYVDQTENDETVIRAMTVALMSNYVDETRTEILFAIAIYQLGALLWSDTASSQSDHLLTILFNDRSSTVPSHIATVRERLLRWTPSNGRAKYANQDTIDERLRRIDTRK